VHPIQTVLIGNDHPAISRPGVVQPLGVVNPVEAIELALWPRIFESRHDRDGTVTGGGEPAGERAPAGSQQILVIALIGDAQPGQQAGMRQPGYAAESAGLHPGRDASPAGGIQRLLQRGELAGQWSGEAGIVENQRAVGFEKQNEHVAPFEPLQVGTGQRRLRGEPASIPEHGRGQRRPDLLGEHPGNRQRKPMFGRQARI